MRAVRRILFALLSLIVVLGILFAVLGPLTVRRSFPQTSGDLSLSGLDGPVDIYRDAHGVPHIYAATSHDLFFAQGYVHAQDRFWQMDFWRHTGAGRLSEMFGEAQLETDQFLRTMGWGRVARQELEGLDAGTRSALEAYAEGVNAYLADHQGSALSLEYAVLKLINPGYQVEPWEPLNTLTWAKAMAWDLRANMDEEIERSYLLKTLTPAQVDEIFPYYAADMPVIVQEDNRESKSGDPTAPFASGIQTASSPEFSALETRISALDALLGGGPGMGLGSNSWAVSGRLTATGQPLLANDPHLAIQMPSIWYEIGLHCAPRGDACPIDVAGFSFAGAPAVIIGHNDRIAWGFTNVGPDVMDLYIEKLNPANPNQYEVNGEWVDMEIVKETIQVAGGEPVEVSVRLTRHGPVMSDVSQSMAEMGQKGGLEMPPAHAIALRWTALEPSNLFRAVLGFNLAQNWDEFRRAATDFAVPSQNLIYADVDGNIGYQMPGLIPIRAAGNGRLPVPGWTDEYEWQGYIPFAELPNTFNPPQGYIVTANNAVVSQDYPYLITTEWDYGYRARRIVSLIENAPGPIDMAYFQQMQGDNYNSAAEILVPHLLDLPLDDARLDELRSSLRGWDYQNHMDSAPAALFEAFHKHLLDAAFRDDLLEDSWLATGSRSDFILSSLVDQPDSAWWDDKATSQIETRDQIFTAALALAANDLEARLGRDASKWTWGDLHLANFRNRTLGESGIAPIEALFNREGFRASGGSSIVNATSWSATAGDYLVRSLPSMRMIVDLGNLAGSLTIHPTGQSGHAYHPHYIDFADLWRNIQYHPMLWQRSQVEAGADSHLRLAP